MIRLIEQPLIKLHKTKKYFVYESDADSNNKDKIVSATDLILQHKVRNCNNEAYSLDTALTKCREKRQSMRSLDLKNYGYFDILNVCQPSFHKLIEERDLKFDVTEFPLGETFAKMIDCPFSELETIHLKYNSDKGHIKDRNEKRKLFEGVLDRSRRQQFHSVFLKFILNYIAPHIQSITNCTSFYFQGFPCIRLVRPREFSIGPHCDSSYGFSQGNINFYIPLTRISGANSLFLESSPGLEDWHTIESTYGNIKRFWGAQCSHFTITNETDQTRISLDFRIIEDHYFLPAHDQFTSKPGYYSRCYRSESNDVWVIDEKTLVSQPDYRFGFPFERKL